MKNLLARIKETFRLLIGADTVLLDKQANPQTKRKKDVPLKCFLLKFSLLQICEKKKTTTTTKKLSIKHANTSCLYRCFLVGLNIILKHQTVIRKQISTTNLLETKCYHRIYME
jgi:hypothetical protein